MEEGRQRLRAFYALSVVPEVRQALHRQQQQWQTEEGYTGAEWVLPEDYHLTIRFLGSIRASTLMVLNETVAETVNGSGSLTLTLQDVMAFPDTDKARVVAIGINSHARLLQLVERVEGCATAFGLLPEHRLFRPHITLLRRRSPQMPMPALIEDCTWPTWRVDKLGLFVSLGKSRGARYRTIAEIDLSQDGWVR